MDEEDLKKMLHFPEQEPYWNKQENDYRPQKTSKDFALQLSYYTTNAQVSVKKSEITDYIVIKKMKGLHKIT